MSEENSIVIRSDLENIINVPSDQYENNLQQELEELFLDESDEEGEEALIMTSEEDNDDEDDEDEDEEEDEDTPPKYPDDNYIFTDYKNSQSGQVCLTEEEQGIINNCTDPKLKQLLLMNRTKAVHIKELCKKLRQLYDQLGVNIRKEREKFRQDSTKEYPEIQSMAKTYIWRIGIPFFKDKSFYSAPPNKDLALKRENKELFATKIGEGRKWTTEDQQILRDSVVTGYFMHKKNQTELDIRLLRAGIKNGTKGELAHMEELKNLEKRLEEIIASKNEPPPLNCAERIDWLQIANFDLKGRHTHLECKAFWNIYLHPEINKTDWLPEENEKIKELALAYNYDWDLIANELNTNRSPYLVCVHYNTKLCDKFRRQRFLHEEDEFLIEVVENCRLGDYIPWGRVAYYFEDRSKHQLYHRYKYYLACKNIKKGTFTEAEDVLLTYLVERYGKDFSTIADYMPHRTSIQLRNRYSSYLQKVNIQLGNFTLEDDDKILNHVKENGHKNWNVLAREMNRTRAHVRQRYLTLRKTMEKHPTLTIDALPRRKQSFLSNYQRKKNARMEKCLVKVRELSVIPTLATVETYFKEIESDIAKKRTEFRVLRVPVRKTRSEIDYKLIDFFKGTCKFQRELKITDEKSIMDSARRIIKLFHALGADPNILKGAQVPKVSLNAILINVNTILGTKGKNNFISEPIPGPSHSDPIDLPRHQLKNLLPPNVNTLLGLRGMIVKFQIHKMGHKKTDPVSWKIEQNLLKLDGFTKSKIQFERDIFYRRLCALLKWPCILSTDFPRSLSNPKEENQEDSILEEQLEKRKVGRPVKTVNNKVLKMVEARKRKKLDEPKKNDNEIIKTETKYRKVEEPKKKRGRPVNTVPAEHALAYIPRRSHFTAKGNKPKNGGEEEEETDDPEENEKETNQPSTSKQKIINLSDLKLINSNSIVVNQDKINKLIELNNIKNPQKIIVLQGTSSNIISNPSTKIPDDQSLQLKEPKEEIKSENPENNHQIKIQQPPIDLNNSPEMICINKEKYKSREFLKNEKEILAQGLDKIEKDGQEESEMNTNYDDVKMENECLEELDEEMDLEDGEEFLEEYKKIMNDTCNKETEAVIESKVKSKSIMLNATIQKMKDKMKRSLNNS